MSFKEVPIQIEDDGLKVFSILRTNMNSDSILILVPAMTGNRLGPQNIYVEISRLLAKNDIASLCVDLPPAGDSYDNHVRSFHGNYDNNVDDKYSFYLTKVLSYLKDNYNYSNIFIGSISVGCMPVLNFCKRNDLSGVVLLSPNHFGENRLVDMKNVRRYYYKFFKMETWQKLFSFKINFKKVIHNVLRKSRPVNTDIDINKNNPKSDIKILCVFGEKDSSINDCIQFWEEYIKKIHVEDFSYDIISEADHSFFGWNFKQNVCNTVLKWTVNNSKKIQ